MGEKSTVDMGTFLENGEQRVTDLAQLRLKGQGLPRGID